MIFKAIVIYLCFISIVSIVVCCYDKIAAKHNPKHRTRESTLLWLSVLGGSLAMYCTMQLIRHKTKHVKFMLGIPLIIIVQIAIPVCIHLFLYPLF